MSCCVHQSGKLLEAWCTLERNKKMLHSDQLLLRSIYLHVQGLRGEHGTVFHRPQASFPSAIVSLLWNKAGAPQTLLFIYCMAVKDRWEDPWRFWLPSTVTVLEIEQSNEGAEPSNRCIIKDRASVKRRQTEEASGTLRASYSIWASARVVLGMCWHCFRRAWLLVIS